MSLAGTVHLPQGRTYGVHVGPGLLTQLHSIVPWPAASRRAVVITQGPVRAHYGQTVLDGLRPRFGDEVTILEFPDGEAAKTPETVTALHRELARLPLGRGDMIIALGGGVVGDLAGYVAATYNRGVSFVQVPTTLLAQVDASIGGKTGVNLPEGKNLVGAFHQPLAVIADTSTLATLSPRVAREGFGEIVKYGFAHDSEILDALDRHVGDPLLDADLRDHLVRTSAAVKCRVVSADERESGERAFLNLGHTFGHAIEAMSGYGEWLHGEAVSAGLVVALRLGEELGLHDDQMRGRAIRTLTRLGLPTLAPRVDRAEAWSVMARDKKAQDGVRFVVLSDYAAPRLVTPDREAVDRAISHCEEQA